MWVRYTKSDGIWEINIPNLEFFMRSCAHADAVLKNSTTNTEFVALGPDLTTVDVNWPAARNDRDESAAALRIAAARRDLRLHTASAKGCSLPPP